jgi:hypothetical protein
MIHLQWETTASPEGDAASPAGDLLASPDFGICDTTQIIDPDKLWSITESFIFFF